MSPSERQVIGRKWKNAMIAPPALAMRRPSMLAELAWKRWKEGEVDDPALLAPIYLHVAGMIQE
jgi:tRNA threonylcarbamoyladenosine biosynthesis protein TsaB